MSKIVTVTFIVDDDRRFFDLEHVREAFKNWGFEANISVFDYPDRSEKSKWDRPFAREDAFECQDSCCNQAV